MPFTLELAGHLAVLAGGDPIAVEFRGGVIEVRFSSLRQAWALRRRLDRPRRRAWLRRAREALARADVELQVWVGRRRLGRLASDSRPTRLAAWLGIDPFEIDVWAGRGARRRGAGGPPAPRRSEEGES